MMPGTVARAPLPPPADLSSAIRRTKRVLRERVGDVAAALAEAEYIVGEEARAILAQHERGEEVWPVVRFDDVASGSVPPEVVAQVRRRGCAVVTGTFPRALAEEWDRHLADYLDRNHFDRSYRYVDDGVFGGLAASRPSIYPIYWSKPQIQARQDDRMAVVRQFLNSFWSHESEGRVWFDPSRDCAYPDRVRRRPPGSSSTGLSPHIDSGSIERWLVPAYQQVFRHVFDGRPSAYDPWDGAYRSEVDEYDSTVMSSAFRTFQGWTALSDMAPTEGVLYSFPVPSAIAVVLLRALQDDVAADDLCGAVNGQSLPITARWHPLLQSALSPIPSVEAGDTVWWHCDLIHGVNQVTDQKGWGNVMYIPASPYCEKNAAYAASCGRAFVDGKSAPDFAPEHYETGWQGRATTDDLNPRGRQQLGLA